MWLYKFELTYYDKEEVNEPKGFDSFRSTIKRDFKSHGTIFKFTDRNIQLGFIGRGRTILKTAFQTDGIDAEVTLDISRKRSGTNQSYANIYTGTADFETFVLDELFANVDFEEFDLNQLIKNRFDIVYSTDKITTIDGSGMYEPSFDEVAVQGRTIELISTASRDDEGTNGLFNSGSWQSGELLLSQSKNEIRFIDGTLAYNQTDVNLSTLTYTLGGVMIMKNLLNIPLEFDISTVGDFILSGSSSTGGDLEFRYGVETYDILTNTLENTVSYLINDFDLTTLSTPAAFDATGTQAFSVPNGKYLKILMLLEVTTAGDTDLTVRIDTDFILTDTWQSVYPENTVNTYSIFEILNKNIEYISGTPSLKSDVFQRPNGLFSYASEVNGYGIRSFTDRAIKGSLEERLNDLQAVFGIGWGLELDGETEIFRVEPYEHFYQDNLIQTHSNIEIDSYKEELFDPLMFNKISLGYDTFANDDLNIASTLDDVNTRYNYIVPVKKYSREQSFVSDYIASDYVLEVTRRLQFDIEPTTSWKYDDNRFLVYLGFDYDANLVTEPILGDWTFENIKNSSSVINQFINPRFNLYNQHLIINSSYYGKELSESVINSGGFNNEAAIIKLSSDDPRSLNGYHNANMSMSDDVTLTSFGNGERLFDPIKITYKIALSDLDIQEIIDENQNVDGSKGYIQVINPDGETKKGHLLEMSYNYNEGIAEIQLIQRNGDI